MTGLLDAPPAPGTPASAQRVERPDTAADLPTPASGPPARRFGPLWRPAGYYLVSRLAMFATAFAASLIAPRLRNVGTFGSIWDGRWYLWIAQHGYPHQLVNEGQGNRWAFFPAFPALVRGVAEVTRLSLPDAATLSAFLLGLTATLGIWLAIREVLGTRLADRASLLFVCCPTAFVLSLGYTEGLFLTAAALCLFALSRRWWLAAGLSACIAGLTRNTGIVVIAAVLITALPAAWRSRTVRPALGAAIAPLGLIGFMGYAWAMVGTPLAFLSSERFWQGQHFVFFTTPLRAVIGALEQGPGGHTFVPDALASAALIVGLSGIWILDRLGRDPALLPVSAPSSSAIPASWWMYTVGTLLLAYSAYFADSMARYAMVAFPLFAAFAWKLPERITGLVAALLLCVQAALLLAVLTIVIHPVAIPLVP